MPDEHVDFNTTPNTNASISSPDKVNYQQQHYHLVSVVAVVQLALVLLVAGSRQVDAGLECSCR